MFKQRILGLALSLALLATFGLSLTANAAETSGDINVTGSTVNAITLEVGPDTINFGNGLNILGDGAGAGVQEVCGVANGARYIGSNVTVTVSSSTAYTVNRGVTDLGSSPAAQMADNTYVAHGPYAGACQVPTAVKVSTIISNGNTEFEDNGSAGMNIQDSEFYVVDVLVGQTPGTYQIKVTYSAMAS